MSPYERAVVPAQRRTLEDHDPADRESWRNLVNKFPPMPPSPPGLRVIPEPPPLPAAVGSSAGRVSTAARY